MLSGARAHMMLAAVLIATTIVSSALARHEGAPRPEPEGSVLVRVGDDIQAFLALYSSGTTFVFDTGVHRLRETIDPRDGDTFLGREGAVLSGARLLETFSREGDLWVATNQSQGRTAHGQCRSVSPRCGHPEDLFIDHVPLRHVPEKGQVRSGTWYFDYDSDRIYFADDPTGRTVETSIVGGAIVGDADDVTVRGLVVEKFANSAQRGAIFAERTARDVSYGWNWVIEGNVVRLNHGVGIRAAGGARIVDNHVLHNGQLGVASNGPGATLLEGNEIAYNNFAGFVPGWEAGGTKFVRTEGLVVRGNYVHNNDGPGLWTDIDNVDTLFEDNVVEYNSDTGIFHEISYRAVIRNNTVSYNGLGRGAEGRYAYEFGTGFLVFNSPDVEVYGNVLVGNWNGINGLQHDRGSGRFGPHELRNLHVHSNDVHLPYHDEGRGPQNERGISAMTGVVQAGGFDFVFSEAYNNRFENNTYTLDELVSKSFAWRNLLRDFVSWQRCMGNSSAWPGCRQDLNGSIRVAARTAAHDCCEPRTAMAGSRVKQFIVQRSFATYHLDRGASVPRRR